ncbi:hypothetical protein GCM10009662_47800 [Catellatospora coxensis]|uniref:Uncharacterized protein n=1 Tax=Catellatospora coxensis TaxID=310354 RepID=A0A8J3P6Z5_9ACTN|nr:hypothetical protein Cco03nite_31360 [Catellatospora coxensis]
MPVAGSTGPATYLAYQRVSSWNRATTACGTGRWTTGAAAAAAWVIGAAALDPPTATAAPLHSRSAPSRRSDRADLHRAGPLVSAFIVTMSFQVGARTFASDGGAGWTRAVTAVMPDHMCAHAKPR